MMDQQIGFRYLPLKEVLHFTGLSKSPLYERVKTGDFPKPIALSKQCVRWRSDEVFEWMNRQSAQRGVGSAERSAKARSAAQQRKIGGGHG